VRVLVVEDDRLLGDGIQAGLRAKGFTPDWVTDGEGAELALRQEPFDLLVLDWLLPDRSGIAILRRLREAGDTTPVLLLTVKDEVADRVEGLDAGADDYLTKPFDLEELAARLRALSRRRSQPYAESLRVGDLVFDPEQMVAGVADREIPLGRREGELLEVLMSQPGIVITRDRLEERLFGWDEAVASNALQVHIHHLRQKIGPQRIETVRGIGYRFVAD